MIELITTPTKTIRVDVVGAFTNALSAEQTDYTVENGTSRTDHKILQPATLDLEIAQTETPIDAEGYGLQQISVSPELPSGSNTPSTPLEYEVEQVRTEVRSPFLLAGGALVQAGDAIAGALLGKAIAPRMLTLQKSLGTSKTPQALAQEVYTTDTPTDRGGALRDELEALLLSESDLVSVTYKGRTYAGLSLVSLEMTYAPGEGGLTRFRVSFKRIPIATLEETLLPNPEDLAQKNRKSKGKQKSPDGSESGKTGEKQQSSVAYMIAG